MKAEIDQDLVANALGIVEALIVATAAYPEQTARENMAQGCLLATEVVALAIGIPVERVRAASSIVTRLWDEDYEELLRRIPAMLQRDELSP